MTAVHFHLTDAQGNGLAGKVGLVPSRRVTVEDAIRLPVVQLVVLDAGEATVDVLPSTTQWAWRVTEYVAGGTTRYVEVPDSAAVVEYSALSDIDPASLDQTSNTVAAWDNATRAAQSVLDKITNVDDKVTAAADSAKAAKTSESNAAQSASAAQASASAAAQSVQSIGDSVAAAADSAKAAKTSESNAAQSASAAASSAQ